MEIYQVYPQLFHYTGIGGLKGILESKCLHLTQYNFLNDSSEMISIRPKILEFSKRGMRRGYERMAQNRDARSEMENEGGIESVVAEHADRFVTQLYNVTMGDELPYRHFEPYISSFCGHEDPYEIENGSLSQWRGYGRNAGYALVFDNRCLRKAAAAEFKRYCYNRIDLCTVVYEGDAQGFDCAFSELIDRATRLSEQAVLDSNSVKWEYLLDTLLNATSRYKNRGFAEEQEVRLVASPMSQRFIDRMIADENPKFKCKHSGKDPKDLKFRDNLAPYIELPFHDDYFPITKIIVGPHVDQENLRERLVRYLGPKNLEIIQVSCSQIPFRATS